MRFSQFGEKIAGKSGISVLMDDLGKALASGGKIMLGGGNPSHIPEVQQRFRQAMQRILDQAVGKTLVVSMSRPMELSRFDRILELRLGKVIFDGDPAV